MIEYSDKDYLHNQFLEALDLYLLRWRHQPTFQSSFAYLLKSGKHLRPLLVLSTAQDYKLDIQKIMPLALGIEMIHAYSLVHDDLPCMDNDSYRRAKPCLHVFKGQAAALLVGDALLTHSMVLFQKSLIGFDLPSKELKEYWSYWEKSLGIEGMIGGQYLDITEKKQNTSSRKKINAMKTGALMALSIFSVPFLSRSKHKSFFYELGYRLGDLFQRQDDLLDGETKDDKTLDAEFQVIEDELNQFPSLRLLVNIIRDRKF